MDKISANQGRGFCGLLICGDHVNFKTIEDKIGFRATRIFIKNQPIAEYLPDRISETNSWLHTHQYSDLAELNDCLKILLEKILFHKDFLNTLIKDGIEIYIIISVISDLAQIGFEVEPDTITLLTKLGVPLQISILSFGGAIDE